MIPSQLKAFNMYSSIYHNLNMKQDQTLRKSRAFQGLSSSLLSALAIWTLKGVDSYPPVGSW